MEVRMGVKVQKALVRFDRPIRRETAGLGRPRSRVWSFKERRRLCRAKHASDPRLNAPTVMRAAGGRREKEKEKENEGEWRREEERRGRGGEEGWQRFRVP
jgi:hypothetical protein